MRPLGRRRAKKAYSRLPPRESDWLSPPGCWVRARHVAERDAIAARYAEWELSGPPEIRAGADATFSPWRAVEQKKSPGT
jgi:hypothetical protein